jgi:predicted acetyltransferase
VVSRDLLIRTVRQDELRTFFDVSERTFGDEPAEGDFEKHRNHVEPARAHAAFDGDALVATAAAYSFTFTVPGGEVPAAGVTMVGVLPSHRRRGVLRGLMREQLDDVRRRGEPLAVLWASEAPIYGRFGYGLAASTVRVDADRGLALRPAPEASAHVRLVPRDSAFDVVAPIYERVRKRTPGAFVRTPDWWHDHRLADGPRYREGAGPLFVAVVDVDGVPAGFARYRIKGAWTDGVPEGTVDVGEVHGETPAATFALWRYLLDIDLTTRVKASVPVDSPLYHGVLEPRRLRWRVADALFLRVVDVGAAFAARSFAGGESIVLDLADEFCEWNAGRWEIGGAGGARRTDAQPDLALGAEELAAVYLGGTTVRELAEALRVRELRDGGIARADALLRTERAPWCPEVF